MPIRRDKKAPKVTPNPEAYLPGAPQSRPMKTTDEQRLAHLRADRPPSRPMKTTDAERLAHKGYRPPRDSASDPAGIVIDVTPVERGSIVKAALKFRRRPTPANRDHLVTLVDSLKERETMGSKDQALEFEARQRKEQRDTEARAAEARAKQTELEALLEQDAGKGDQ